MGITGKFWMRFIGNPDGKLMKGAPGNYIHGKKYHIPFKHSTRKFWKLLEKVPELKVPDEPESFEDAYFVPEEKTATVELTQTTSDIDIDPTSEALIEPYASVNPVTGKMGEHIEHPKKPEKVEEESVEEIVTEPEKVLKELPEEIIVDPPTLDRKALLAILVEADIEVKKGTRTTTLKKMVDALEED